MPMMPPPLKVLLWLLLLLPPVAALAFIPFGVNAARRTRRTPPILTTTRSNKQSPVGTAATPTALQAAQTTQSTTQTPSHHRNIVVLSHNVSQDVADGFFDMNNLLQGRVDVLTRCANSALWVSNNIRQDTTVWIMLFPHNITIEIRGCAVTHLNPDERTMALFLQRTLLSGSFGDDNAGDRNNENGEQLQQTRREVAISRLTERKLERPEIVNPFKPGALPKSERNKLKVARKQRQAMVRRIHRSSNTNTADISAGDSDSATAAADSIGPPAGFVRHSNDSLSARLEQFSAVGPVLMLHETGAPLANVLLEPSRYHHSNDGTSDTRTTTNENTTTTLILGDQIGYAACDEKLLAESRNGSDSGEPVSAVRKVSLGPLSLLTSQCITIAHHYLDLHRC
jgi:tRNA pseudouridine-54 N-methylase